MAHALSRIWAGVRAALATELGAVLALAGAALGVLLFIDIAEDAAEGDTHAFDSAVLLALRTPGDPANPIGPAWLERAAIAVTTLGGYAFLTLLVVAVCAYLLIRRDALSAAIVAGATASGALLSESLKMGFARPRPDLVAHLVEVQSASFPSGHAMLSAIAYLTLGALLARAHERRRAKIAFMAAAILLTLLIGASRVYLGVHWPTDVLGGWSLGAAWAALWWLVDWRAQRARRAPR